MRSRQFDHPRRRASPRRDGPVRDRLLESLNYTAPVNISRLSTAKFCRIARGDSVDPLLVVYVVVPPRHNQLSSNLSNGLNDRGNRDLYCALNALSGASVNSVPVRADTLKFVVVPSITSVAVSISAGVNPTNGVFLLWDAAMRIDHSAPS